MDTRSEQTLALVHPDLAKVIRSADQTPQPFVAYYGIRTLEAEKQAVATGHSTTLHSRHLPQPRYATAAAPHGLACAVDVAPLIGGHLVLDPPNEAEVYGQIAKQIKAAAAANHIPVEWGGDWRTFRDYGHFQLPWGSYP